MRLVKKDELGNKFKLIIIIDLKVSRFFKVVNLVLKFDSK